MAGTERQFVGVLIAVVAAVLIGGVVTAAVKEPSHKSHRAAPLPSFTASPTTPTSPNVAPTPTPTPPGGSTQQPGGTSTQPGQPSGPGGPTIGPQMPNTGLPIGVPIAGGVLVGFALTTRRVAQSYSGRGRP